MNDPHTLGATRPRPLIDGIYRASRQATSTATRALPTRPTAHAQPVTQTIPPLAVKRPSLWQRLQLPLLISGCVIAGFFIQALWFGILLTFIYGTVSLILRVKSSITFGLAMIALVATIIIVTTKPDTSMAGTFAAYAFLLLTIGVIALTIEVRPQKRRRRL